MNVGFINGSILTKFIEDKEVFEKCVNEYFNLVECSGKRGFSQDMFRERFGGFFVQESDPQSKEGSELACDYIFKKFDKDQNGNIDREEFGSLLKEIMVAMAQGLGTSAGLVYLDRNGLLSRAIKHGLAKE